MDNSIEEVEIKIEYNETFEIDPLCDKNINSSESITGIENSCKPDNRSDPCQIVTADKTNIYFNEFKTLHPNLDNLKGSELTWYDLIDDSGRFLCKLCDLKYSTQQTLRFHVKTKHPEHASHIQGNLVKLKRKSKLKCHICKERFKEILALKSHVVNKHSLEDMKTSCLYCDAVFRTENEMSNHLLIQHKKVTRKSTYICKICGYRTSTKSHYNQHQNTHVGDKDKKCGYCDYVTNYSPNLKIHERIHTKDKLYVCEFTNCNYRCSAKSALRSHQLKHNPEDNVLYCDKCSYKTIYRQSLKRHNDCHKRNSLKLKLY